MSLEKTGKEAKASFLHSFSNTVNKIVEAVLFGTLIVMVLVTVAQVVFRFFFTALTWSEELSCFLLVFASLLGTTVAFKKGNHIAITVILDKLKGTLKKLLQTLIALIGIAFFAIVGWYGVVLMKSEATQLTPAMQIPMSWIYLMYPIAGGIVLLHLLDSLVDVWGGKA